MGPMRHQGTVQYSTGVTANHWRGRCGACAMPNPFLGILLIIYPIARMFPLSVVLRGHSLPWKGKAVLVSSRWKSIVLRAWHVHWNTMCLAIQLKCMSRLIKRHSCILHTLHAAAYTNQQWELHKQNSRSLIGKQSLNVICSLSSTLEKK